LATNKSATLGILIPPDTFPAAPFLVYAECGIARMRTGRRGSFMSLTGWRVTVAALVVAAPGIAAAADMPSAAPAPQPTYAAPAVPDWIVTLGAEGRMIPAWPGAPLSKFGFTGFPLFSIRKEGTPPDYFGPRDSFGFSVIDLGQVKFGPAVRIVWEREASSYQQLAGLGDVNFAVQAGAFAEFWAVPWLRLRGEIRQGFGGETGVTGDVFLDAVVPLGQFRWSAGPRLTAQSAKAISPYFSITPAQSIGSTVAGLPMLPVYNAGGGIYSYGAGTQLEYFFNDVWSVHVFGEYERLTGSAADSPLVTQRGSPNQLTFGLGATYSFSMHPLW
jgi:outer membrane protein